jgi:hypothetical protein
MNNSDLVKFYRSTCESYNRKQTEGEIDAWLCVLSEHTTGDLDAALRRWHSDTSIEDFTQKPKGSRMPSTAELKLSIDQFNEKTARTASGKFYSCNNCEEGWLRIFLGRTHGGNTVDPKCGAVRRCQCFNDYVVARGSK